MMDLEAKMIQVLGPLVGNRIWWDQTPDVVPTGDFIILSRVGGQAGWYVEQKVPQRAHSRVQVTGFSQRSANREKLARQIELAMCAADFPACSPMGSWRGFSEVTLKRYACLWQFGVWYDPDVP